MLTAAAQNRYGQNPEPAASNSTWLRVYDPIFVVSTLLMIVINKAGFGFQNAMTTKKRCQTGGHCVEPLSR